MMRKGVIILSFVLTVLISLGCINQTETPKTTPTLTTIAPKSEIDLSKIVVEDTPINIDLWIRGSQKPSSDLVSIKIENNNDVDVGIAQVCTFVRGNFTPYCNFQPEEISREQRVFQSIDEEENRMFGVRKVGEHSSYYFVSEYILISDHQIKIGTYDGFIQIYAGEYSKMSKVGEEYKGNLIAEIPLVVKVH